MTNIKGRVSNETFAQLDARQRAAIAAARKADPAGDQGAIAQAAASAELEAVLVAGMAKLDGKPAAAPARKKKK